MSTVCPVLIAIDPGHFNTAEFTDHVVESVIDDVKASEPAFEGAGIRYPGERDLLTRQDNLKNSIPVLPGIWRAILEL